MALRARADVSLPIEDAKDLEALYRSLVPEVSSSPSKRTAVSIEVNGGNLRLRFTASDTTSLRAVMNSYLRFIAGVKGALDAIKDQR